MNEHSDRVPGCPLLTAWRDTRVGERLLATRHAFWGTIYGATVEERQLGTARCRIADQWYVNFGLADAFGLSVRPEVLAAAGTALHQWGAFYGASRIYQCPKLYRDLEARIARAVGAEEAIVFNSVTTVHCGLLPSLTRQAKCAILIDRFAHNSLWRAAELCAARGAAMTPFPHNDVAALKELLACVGDAFPIVAVDSGYSMGGDFAPLREIYELVVERDGLLYIDDAHGTAVHGQRGGGYAAHELGGVPANVLVAGSLSKALAGNGGFLACGRGWREFVESASEGFIFNGPVPPAMLGADIAALDVLLSGEYAGMRASLQGKHQQILEILGRHGLHSTEPRSHIIAAAMDEAEATRLAGRLFEQGILINVAIFPAVPARQGIIRLTPSLLHTEEDTATLDQALHKAVAG